MYEYIIGPNGNCVERSGSPLADEISPELPVSSPVSFHGQKALPSNSQLIWASAFPAQRSVELYFLFGEGSCMKLIIVCRLFARNSLEVTAAFGATSAGLLEAELCNEGEQMGDDRVHEEICIRNRN